ncbi:hypothetical protein OROMI_026618 [Orobanche minor]
MAGVVNEESGVSNGQYQQKMHSGEAVAEWRSMEQVENGSPSTSPPYWDSDDGEGDGGPKPSDLYGKHTWKIDKFSQINRRELRSNAFEAGGYKWYILIYPQGCDVCNHLSLFLSVANHDKLLPGWSHFAQFTIAVVNKDPKKSKYSDTLHRFWKKEHDWGWKKFMELTKVMDGFIDADTLIIKAQVQVIRERADRPFRCLDCQYRRELVRVYLTTVEQSCRRFVEERRGKLEKLIEDKVRWSRRHFCTAFFLHCFSLLIITCLEITFCAFWMCMEQSSRHRMSHEKTETILKVVVKHFFIEKEVTSTLVMDALYSGLKALESQNKEKKSKCKYFEAEELHIPIVRIEKDAFALADDVLLLLERAAMEPLPPKDEKAPQNRTKDGSAGEEFNKDSIERDERRLTELGRRTIEIFVLAHIFSSKIEVAYQEAVALKKQEELIREEEAAWLAELEQKARRGVTDKEKKSKKKQVYGKQKRINRKGKDKGGDDNYIRTVQYKIDEDIPTERKELAAEPKTVLEKAGAGEDIYDVSDSVDCALEILPLDSEDRYLSPVNWDTDTSEVHPPVEAVSGGFSGVQNGIERRSASVVDDSSSTCSCDSVPSVVVSVANKGISRYHEKQKSPNRGRNHQSKLISESVDWVDEEPIQPVHARHSNDASQSSNLVGSYSQAFILSLHDRVVNGIEQQVEEKEKETGSFQRSPNGKGESDACATTPLRSPLKTIPLVARLNVEPKTGTPSPANSSVLLSSSAENAPTLEILEPQKLKTLKPTENPPGQQIHMGNGKLPPPEVSVTVDKPKIPPPPVMSRPQSAPLVPGPRPAVSKISVVQTAPVLARPASAAGRLGAEPTTQYTNQRYVQQSNRNATIGGHVFSGSLSAYSQNHSSSSGENASHSYSHVFSPRISDQVGPFGMVNQHDFLQKGPVWIEHPNNMQNFELYNPVRSRPQDLTTEFRAGTSGSQSHVLADEFPHLDIINDLLDDEHGIGMVATRVNSGYQSFDNGPHNMNRHYSFRGDPGLSGGPGLSCTLDRDRSNHDEGIQHDFGGSGRIYNTVRDMIPSPQAGPHPYMNGQIDGFMPNQWQMGGGSDVPYLSVRNLENDGGGYPHRAPEYANLSVGINGYTVYRPSSGH